VHSKPSVGSLYFKITSILIFKDETFNLGGFMEKWDEKLWWQAEPKTKEEKEDLIELIEQRLETDELGEFEIEHGPWL